MTTELQSHLPIHKWISGVDSTDFRRRWWCHVPLSFALVHSWSYSTRKRIYIIHLECGVQVPTTNFFGQAEEVEDEAEVSR